ncbi:hypothetical protein CIPAW_01G275400 [Carya illinoinensis]|uniref:Uncharacterized protein n=1 Tax=Carya illinoinensis TaxID=32201 RepID=A0A8T1RUE3_CARIL|nr:hypothetical protein CIPAW_01G275400 [Carya illinoinensis]
MLRLIHHYIVLELSPKGSSCDHEAGFYPLGFSPMYI